MIPSPQPRVIAWVRLYVDCLHSMHNAHFAQLNKLHVGQEDKKCKMKLKPQLTLGETILKGTLSSACRANLAVLTGPTLLKVVNVLYCTT